MYVICDVCVYRYRRMGVVGAVMVIQQLGRKRETMDVSLRLTAGSQSSYQADSTLPPARKRQVLSHTGTPSHTDSRPLSLSNVHTLTHTHTHTPPSLLHTHMLRYSLTHTHTLLHIFSLFLSFTHTHAHTHTHTHTPGNIYAGGCTKDMQSLT